LGLSCPARSKRGRARGQPIEFTLKRGWFQNVAALFQRNLCDATCRWPPAPGRPAYLPGIWAAPDAGAASAGAGTAPPSAAGAVAGAGIMAPSSTLPEGALGRRLPK